MKNNPALLNCIILFFSAQIWTSLIKSVHECFLTSRMPPHKECAVVWFVVISVRLETEGCGFPKVNTTMFALTWSFSHAVVYTWSCFELAARYTRNKLKQYILERISYIFKKILRNTRLHQYAPNSTPQSSNILPLNTGCLASHWVKERLVSFYQYSISFQQTNLHCMPH